MKNGNKEYELDLLKFKAKLITSAGQLYSELLDHPEYYNDHQFLGWLDSDDKPEEVEERLKNIRHLIYTTFAVEIQNLVFYVVDNPDKASDVYEMIRNTLDTLSLNTLNFYNIDCSFISTFIISKIHSIVDSVEDNKKQ